MTRYRVIGPRPVFEVEPGGLLDRDLTHGAETALLGVHLEIVNTPRPAPVKPKAQRRRRAASQPRRPKE